MWNSFVGLLSGAIQYIYEFTESMGYPNYGLAIILFTTILRILMFPLSLMQGKSSKAMNLIQPKVKQLQQQYKNNQEILNREMQSLYRKYNVNPLSGCFPMLIQMPVLFALFSAMRNFNYADNGTSFFGITDFSLTVSELPMVLGIMIPLIVGLSSYLQSKLTMATQPAAGDQAKMMNMMMLYGMPVMIGFMTRNFAAGLAIYWSTFNILGFLMQIGINAMVNRSTEEMKAQMEADDARQVEEAKATDRARAEENRRKKDEQRKKAAERKKAQLNRGRGAKDSSNKGKELDFDD